MKSLRTLAGVVDPYLRGRMREDRPQTLEHGGRAVGDP
jgi:hypothetical protein